MFGSALSAAASQRAAHAAQAEINRQRAYQEFRAYRGSRHSPIRAQIKGRKKVVPLAGYIGAMQISGTFYPIRMGKTNIPEVTRATA